MSSGVAYWRNKLANLEPSKKALEQFSQEFYGLGAERARPIVLALLNDIEADIIAYAVEVVMLADAQWGKQMLPRYLASSDERVRYVVITYLGKTFDDTLVEVFKRIFQAEPDGTNRFAAVACLGAYGTPAVLGMLSEVAATDTAVDYEGHSVANMARQAIAEIKERYGMS